MKSVGSRKYRAFAANLPTGLSLFFGGNKIAENLGPNFLKVSVALQSTFHDGLYAVQCFGPGQRGPKRSEGREEPLG